MKSLFLGSILLMSSTVFAGNYEVRQNFLQARLDCSITVKGIR